MHRSTMRHMPGTVCIDPRKAHYIIRHEEDRNHYLTVCGRHIMLYHAISCYIMLYHVVSCYIMLYHVISCYIMVISCYIMLYHVLSCCIMLYHVISCCIMLYYVVSCCIMFYHVVSCCIMFLSCCIMLYYVISCYIMLHHVLWRHWVALRHKFVISTGIFFHAGDDSKGSALWVAKSSSRYMWLIP